MRNRMFLAVDLIGWALIPTLALALRLDGFGTFSVFAGHLLLFTAVVVICKFIAFWALGLYRRYWLYASIDELILIAGVVVAAGLVSATVFVAVEAIVFAPSPHLPRSVLIIDTLLTLLFVGGSRFAVRGAERVRQRLNGGKSGKRALIVGAGGAGMMIAKELLANPHFGIEPVAFIDDDPAKQDQWIQGLRVLGRHEDIPDAARAVHASDVIIAMPRVPGRVIRDIRKVCDRAALNTKIVPAFGDIICGRVAVSKIRDVQIEDLLRRAPVKTDQVAVAELVRGMTVLVTGAGGSIGSEICRQAAMFGARELILLGHGENSIFDINNELRSRYPDVTVIPVIADIRDRQRITKIFDKYRPQAVFHAAAHKHVPLMEDNPEEAVTNNIGGTLSLLQAAERVRSSHFVFISTDKAVNPRSIMGATKLVAERLVHDAALRTGETFVSVRFGNVLASRGSVVPAFQKQIAKGGPVTVTHPEMCRYFMTIPEAVQLVLQAAALGRGGETFVLDMGEPVKILELAQDLIELSGLEVGRDIEIEFSGLRPGEKLFEELFLNEEDFARTQHEKIFVAKNGNGTLVSEGSLEQLLAAAESDDHATLRHMLDGLVPGTTALWAEASLRPLVSKSVGTPS